MMIRGFPFVEASRASVSISAATASRACPAGFFASSNNFMPAAVQASSALSPFKRKSRASRPAAAASESRSERGTASQSAGESRKIACRRAWLESPYRFRCRVPSARSAAGSARCSGRCTCTARTACASTRGSRPSLRAGLPCAGKARNSSCQR